jgi:gluconolactonase
MFVALTCRVHHAILAGTACAVIAGCGSMMTSPARIFAEGAQFEEMSRAGRAFAEGVVAAKDGKIYLTDITRTVVIKQNNPGGTIYRYDPVTGEIAKFMEPSGMANGLHVDRNGDLIIAQDADTGGRAVLRRNLTTGATTVVVNSYQGKRLNSPNDVTSDARGRIYFTDARYGGNEPMELPNAIYRVDPDGKTTQLATDILRPNGIEVSPDGKRLYVAASNSPTLPANPNGPAQDRFGLSRGGVVVYDLDSNGSISNGRLFYRNDDFGADGMAMDTDGNLYVALHNGNPKEPKGAVVVLAPDGTVLMTRPAADGVAPTNLGFGRGRDANLLYMTSGFRWGLYRIKTERRGHYFE